MESAISLSGKNKDFQALEKKLSKGIPLDEAAAQSGLTLDECYDYIKGRSEHLDTLNYELRKAGQKAIEKALDKLTKLSAGEARYAMMGETCHSVDLEAAKTLAKFGLEALKLSKSAKTAGTTDQGQPDLFDASGASVLGPWVLKKIE